VNGGYYRHKAQVGYTRASVVMARKRNHDWTSSDSDAYSDNEFEPAIGPRKKKNPKISNNNADTSQLTSS